MASWYSLTNIRQMEGLVDQCLILFDKSMDKLQGQPLDLGLWVEMYAFDVIGNLTFLKPFGMMEAGDDLGHLMDGLEFGTLYGAMVGQVPELHPWLLGGSTMAKLWMKIPLVGRNNPAPIVIKVSSRRDQKPIPPNHRTVLKDPATDGSRCNPRA